MEITWLILKTIIFFCNFNKIEKKSYNFAENQSNYLTNPSSDGDYYTNLKNSNYKRISHRICKQKI